jgi:hypothetical protein
MAEIVQFESGRGDSASLIDKARQLLTRHWPASSWRWPSRVFRSWLIARPDATSPKRWPPAYLPNTENASASTHMTIAITDVHFAKTR